MPRARFAKAVNQTGDAAERASVREALWFDVAAADSSDDVCLAESRVALFDHTALLLGATHLLLGVTCLVRHPELVLLESLSNPVIPLTLLLVLNVAAAPVEDVIAELAVDNVPTPEHASV